MDLKTKRLSIRELTIADTDELFAVLSDPEVMRYVEPPYTRQQTAAFITEVIRAEFPPAFAVTLQNTGTLIGYLSWFPCDSESHELGWVLRRDCWEKGYASELTECMLNIAKQEMRHVVIQCVPEQAAARRIAEKFGFFFLGVENGLNVYRFLAKCREGCLTDEQRSELIRSYMGQTVDVFVDRPIGYIHVTGGITLHYTVNYGFLPDVTGGDGEEQDVYILGVEEPVERFTGRVIGAIRRSDDNEDKLVVAPEGMVLHQGQIAEAVHFVEQYFTSTIASIYRKSCGVIPYRKTGSRLELLLLLQTCSQGWSFPKGHMEAFESETDTALREMGEECGLTAQLHPGFRAVMEYDLRGWMHKQVVLFLGEASGEPQLQQAEISDYRWVTPAEAMRMLHPDYIPILRQVEELL
ncbi:MAG: GNAT family N-acetyltransferase [Oscillospiraceae bacterium]|nr:GNAT family N-acetyltransferase [Oscillospiraceae bacterium]